MIHPGEYRRHSMWVTSGWGFNMRLPPLDDVRVRQALALAFDRPAFTRAVYGAYELPADGGVLPPGMPGHAAGIGLPYDLPRARELLAEAGYPQGHGFPELSLLANDTGRSRSEARWLAEQWQAHLGITCRQHFLEPTQFRTLQMEHRLPTAHVFTLRWCAAYPDPDSVLRSWYEDFVQPQTGCCHEAYEALVEEARYQPDQVTRVSLYRQADALLVRDAIALPLRYYTVHLLVKPWARRYHMSALAAPFFERVTMEPH
jgi:oligopeptide transport system substrate-binding protein